VIALHRLADHPQLVSTSRHVTQGVIDITTVSWNGATATLSGKSKLVGEDPYELRIFAPQTYQANSAAVSDSDKKAGVAAKLEQDGTHVRVMLTSTTSREVTWSVIFKK